jgi:hypothetical protein
MLANDVIKSSLLQFKCLKRAEVLIDLLAFAFIILINVPPNLKAELITIAIKILDLKQCTTTT